MEWATEEFLTSSFNWLFWKNPSHDESRICQNVTHYIRCQQKHFFDDVLFDRVCTSVTCLTQLFGGSVCTSESWLVSDRVTWLYKVLWPSFFLYMCGDLYGLWETVKTREPKEKQGNLVTDSFCLLPLLPPTQTHTHLDVVDLKNFEEAKLQSQEISHETRSTFHNPPGQR